jgi:hypothetical protein
MMPDLDLGDPDLAGPMSDPMGPMGGPGMGMGRGMMGPGGQGEMGQQMMLRKQQELERIKQEDPERYKRIERIRELGIEYRNTDDVKRQKEIEKELKPLVDQELRIQQENNKKRVAELEKRLEHMKKVLKQRDQNWDQVVDFTVKEITGQNDYLRPWKGGGPRK